VPHCSRIDRAPALSAGTALRCALLVLSLAIAGPAGNAMAWGVAPQSTGTPHIDAALMEYNQVAKIKPSRIGAEDFRGVIHKRVQCYETVTTPLDRKKPCNISYVEGIVHAARKNIRSIPRMGQFVREVQYCPIMFNMCIGEMNSQDYCIDYERRCIDQALDKYWRGAPENVSRD
jgi:hypothetical protein